MILAITLILWCVYALFDGFVQAHYYDLYPTDKGHKNIHWAYMICRLFLLTAIYFAVDERVSVWSNIIFCFSLIFIFSFFHNGMYYTTRHKLNPKIYEEKFFSNSETSQAVFEFDVKFRIMMCALGLLFAIYQIVASYNVQLQNP